MSSIKYLFDENVPESFVVAIMKHEPSIVVQQVGRDPAPGKQTKDLAILTYAENELLTLVTLDRRSMPEHIADHLAAGNHTCGVLIMRNGFSLKEILDDLVLIWSGSNAEEWQDRLEWLPM